MTSQPPSVKSSISSYDIDHDLDPVEIPRPRCFKVYGIHTYTIANYPYCQCGKEKLKKC